MESANEYWTAKALLDWQVEMGADEAICDAPIDRYALEAKMPVPKAAATAAPPEPPAPAPKVDPVGVATLAAAAAQDLEGLHAALTAFEHCELKAAARNLIFSEGVAGAPVMILTDAPDRAEDRAGRLFTGAAGALFDKMFAAIGFGPSTDAPVYAAPVVPWNPPQNRDPNAGELAMMRPFVERHIALAAPKVIVLLGNTPCQMLLGKSGMTRLRGDWTQIAGIAALPMFAPSYLLRNGAAKREAWADLLALKARLRSLA